jgi:hypothetical protein
MTAIAAVDAQLRKQQAAGQAGG